MLGTAVLALLMLSSLVAVPVHAQASVACNGAVADEGMTCYPTNPVWATLIPAAQGNYPGGNEIFSVFVVNSAPSPNENFTIYNMTLSAPFGPGGTSTCSTCSNYGIGLPATITPGQAFAGTIALQVPVNITQSSFTANLVINGGLWNGTANNAAKLTGMAAIYVLALPGQSSTDSNTSHSGTVSTTLFGAGVAIPSIIAVVLLALVVQTRGRSKRTGM
jgi:hypothetical protein